MKKILLIIFCFLAINIFAQIKPVDILTPIIFHKQVTCLDLLLLKDTPSIEIDTTNNKPLAKNTTTGEVGVISWKYTTGATGVTGATGTAGAAWWSGAYPPSPMTGVSGDFYINTATDSIWQKIVGSWLKIAYIKGSDGSTGATGATGLQGIQGATGATGSGGGGGSSVMDSLNLCVFPKNPKDTLVADSTAGFVDKGIVFKMYGSPVGGETKVLPNFPAVSLRQGNPFNAYGSSSNFLSIQNVNKCAIGNWNPCYGVIIQDISESPDYYNDDVPAGIVYSNGWLLFVSNYDMSTGKQIVADCHPAFLNEFGGQEGNSWHTDFGRYAWKNAESQVFIMTGNTGFGGLKGATVWSDGWIHFPAYNTNYSPHWIQPETKFGIVMEDTPCNHYEQDSLNNTGGITIINNQGKEANSCIDLFKTDSTFHHGAYINMTSGSGTWINSDTLETGGVIGGLNFNIEDSVVVDIYNVGIPYYNHNTTPYILDNPEATIHAVKVENNKAELQLNASSYIIETNGLDNYIGLFKVPYGGYIGLPTNTTGGGTFWVDNDTATATLDYHTNGSFHISNSSGLISITNHGGYIYITDTLNQLRIYNYLNITGRLTSSSVFGIDFHQYNYSNTPPTYPVLGNLIAHWTAATGNTDLSGNGNNLTGTVPIVSVTNGSKTFYTWQFDGSTTYFSFPTMYLTNCTFIAVLKEIDYSGVTGLGVLCGTDNNQYGIGYWSGNSLVGGYSTCPLPYSGTTSWYEQTNVYNWSGATATQSINKVPLSGSPCSIVGDITIDKMGGNGIQFLKGYVAEILIYDTNISAPNITIDENALNTKYDLGY